MDDGRKNAVRPPVPAAARQTPARAVLRTPPPPPDAAAGGAPPQRQLQAAYDDEEPVEAVDESAAAAGHQEQEDHDDDDEEQVERFYALLASIRAMRSGLPAPPCSGGGTGARTKRTTRAEPPWTPAFRMEDFEERPSQRAWSSKRQRQTGDGADGGGGERERPPVVVVVTPTPMPTSSPPLPHAADRLDDRRAANNIKD